jgi:hypothetical protein
LIIAGIKWFVDSPTAMVTTTKRLVDQLLRLPWFSPMPKGVFGVVTPCDLIACGIGARGGATGTKQNAACRN